MGAEVCRTVQADAQLELVAAVDPFHAGEDLLGLTVAAISDALAEAFSVALVPSSLRMVAGA